MKDISIKMEFMSSCLWKIWSIRYNNTYDLWNTCIIIYGMKVAKYQERAILITYGTDLQISVNVRYIEAGSIEEL